MTEADLKGNFDDISLASQGIGEIVALETFGGKPWNV